MILFLVGSSVINSKVGLTTEPVSTTTLSPPLRTPTFGTSDSQFGLAVAHCKEDLSWFEAIDDITLDQGRNTTWDPIVYERCKDDVSPNKYSTWQRNMGDEECTAYLKYIVTLYEKLPEVVYFLQPDSLGFNQEKGHQHTSFTSLQELVTASAPLLLNNKAHGVGGYLSLGNATIKSVKISTPDGPNNPAEIFGYMRERAPLYNPEGSHLVFVPGSSFAVRREKIWAHPPEFYKDLLLDVMKHQDERWTCWSLEASWHVIFGEPLSISDEARVTHHLK